jgi:hypothetical protein
LQDDCHCGIRLKWRLEFFSAMILLVTLILGTLYASLVWLLVRSFLLAWILVLVGSCLNYAFGSVAIVLINIHIYPFDFLNICLLSAGIVRFRFQDLRFSILSILVGGYLLLFGLSVARGLTAFDITTVGNEGRGLIGEALALTYFTTIPHDWKTVKKVVLAQIAFSTALVLICVLHYAGVPIGGAVGITNGQKIYDVGAIDRGLPAGAAASIELSLIFAASWATHRRHSRWLPWLIGIFIPLLIVMQHRTVWAMIAITVAAAGLIDSKVIRYLWKIGGAVAVIACIVIFSYIGLRSRLSEELQNSATNTGTLQWRIEGWVESVSADQSPLSVLIGLPVGSGYIRLDPGAGGYTNFPPHNEIVNQYLRVGVLGAVIVTLFMFRPIYIYFRDPDSGSLLYPTPASWIVVTIGVIVFGIPYSFSLELFALVAMANRLMEAPSEGTYGQFPAFQSFKAASR